MNDLLKNWKKVSAKIKNSPYLLLLSDFDGTLCPIVSHPDLVKVDEKILHLLKRLNKVKGVVLGFVSGRPVVDVKKELNLNNVYYVGNHGLEIKKPRSSRIEIQAKKEIAEVLKVFKQLKPILKKKINHFKGVWMEDKKYSLTIHYRQAAKEDTSSVIRIINEIIAEAENRELIRVTRGKKVFELRPPFNQNKGTAVQKLKKIYSKKKALMIYLGDDVTDEDVFKVMDREDIGIHIGSNKKSYARYCLKNVKAVADFLEKVYLLRGEKINA
jgi:trehalose-phosphatase